MAAEPEINGTPGSEATAEASFGHYVRVESAQMSLHPTAMDIPWQPFSV